MLLSPFLFFLCYSLCSASNNQNNCMTIWMMMMTASVRILTSFMNSGPRCCTEDAEAKEQNDSHHHRHHHHQQQQQQEWCLVTVKQRLNASFRPHSQFL